MRVDSNGKSIETSLVETSESATATAEAPPDAIARVAMQRAPDAAEAPRVGDLSSAFVQGKTADRRAYNREGLSIMARHDPQMRAIADLCGDVALKWQHAPRDLSAVAQARLDQAFRAFI